MQRILWLCLLCGSCLSYAQSSQAPITAGQVGYFRRLFLMIGSADLDAALLSHNRNGIERNFGLNAAESALLESTAETFRTTMMQIRQSEKAIVAGKSTLTDSDRSAIAQLVQTRDAMVSNSAANLLASVRPETANRLIADAQVMIDSQAKKGAH